MKISFIELRGPEARPYIEEIAQLRIKVFAAWPYIYEGQLDYEKKYLQTYFKSKNSFIVLARDDDKNKIVGASTAIWLPDAELEFKKPFLKKKIAPETVCYFGESVLLAEYRGQKIGKRFMELREKFARSFSTVTTVSFCAVIRPEKHKLKPKEYVPLNGFWQKIGFNIEKDMKADFSWRDLGQKKDTFKSMQFWLKKIDANIGVEKNGN